MASDIGGATDRRTGLSTNFTSGSTRDNQMLDRAFVEYLASVLPDGAGLGQRGCAGRGSAKVRDEVFYFDDGCNHQHFQMTY